ncbi:MAG: Txe/YoeB family addiction module toxin [Desulfuromonadales bacterium]|nr:Txe/YoeB family addiction module toxin [Desulfuromonadales bacterium]
MSRQIVFENEGWEDFISWVNEDKKIFLRITELIEEIQRNPFKGIGKPELLKHDKQGYWSRRIDKGNRLLYKVTEDTVIIVLCRGHYEKNR